MANYTGNISSCKRCGSSHLTTGIETNPEIRNPLTRYNDASWYHKCIDCSLIMPIITAAKENLGEEQNMLRRIELKNRIQDSLGEN